MNTTLTKLSNLTQKNEKKTLISPVLCELQCKKFHKFYTLRIKIYGQTLLLFHEVAVISDCSYYTPYNVITTANLMESH